MQELSTFITIDPEICFSKPCIKGTRICVGDILKWLSIGMTTEDIISDYPELQEKQMEAILLQSRESINELSNSNEYGLLEII